MSEILKPCPFCGGQADFFENKIDFVPWPYVQCFDCNAMIGASEGDDKAAMAVRWNARCSAVSECGLCGAPLPCLTHRQGLPSGADTRSQAAPMPQNVEVAIKRMKTLADTALPCRTYEEECQAQMRNACVLLEMAYRSQAESAK